MTYDAWNPEQPPQERFGSGTDAPVDRTEEMPSAIPPAESSDTAQMPAPSVTPLPAPPPNPQPVNTQASSTLPPNTLPPSAPLPSALPPSALPSSAPAPNPQPSNPLPSVAPAARPPQPQPSALSGPPVPPSVPSTGWSSLGATPSRPPTDGGQTQYLPPVSPPGAAVVTPEPKSDRGPRWGWRAVVAFLAGGLIAAAGFGAAQLSGDDADPIETATVATTTPVVTLPPTVRTPGAVPTIPLDAAEPAEFVARTLGPSVVQIDTNFGIGSGVIFGDGLVLTNNHVIEGATSVSVMASDGRAFPGTIVGSDQNTDVAVISIGPGLGLPVAELALGEKARVGQIAIAIGSPFDLQQSVTLGIVSAVDRPIQNSETSVVAMIQTDAPINPGNSGGALADRLGRVIGINTSIQTDGLTAANVGVGFAVPIDTAIRIADLLVAGSPIEPGFLGVRGQPAQPGEAGVVLTEVTIDSAAEAAGLLVGDRVLTFNGAPVTEFVELAGLVLANQAGDVVTMGVIRDGELLELEVTLGLRDN